MFLIDLGGFGDLQFWVDLRLGSPMIELFIVCAASLESYLH